MKKEGIDIALSSGEFILMKGRADLKVKKWHKPFLTGDVYLTNQRFIFKGRRQIRSLIDAAVLGVGKGKRQISIPLHKIKTVEKTKFGLRSLGNEIKISFSQDGKEKWVMFKLTNLGLIARGLASGIGLIGGVIGMGLAENAIGEMASRAGNSAADIAARSTAALEGPTYITLMTRIAASKSYMVGEAASGEAIKNKSLQEVWIAAIKATKDKTIDGEMDLHSHLDSKRDGSEFGANNGKTPSKQTGDLSPQNHLSKTKRPTPSIAPEIDGIEPYCPSCGRKINTEWNVCPYCKTNVKLTCPSCGKEVKEEWEICPFCKQELRPTCFNCGGTIKPEWKVCPYCKTKIS